MNKLTFWSLLVFPRIFCSKFSFWRRKPIRDCNDHEIGFLSDNDNKSWFCELWVKVAKHFSKENLCLIKTFCFQFKSLNTTDELNYRLEILLVSRPHNKNPENDTQRHLIATFVIYQKLPFKTTNFYVFSADFVDLHAKFISPKINLKKYYEKKIIKNGPTGIRTSDPSLP